MSEIVNFPVAINATSSYSSISNSTSAYLIGITKIGQYSRNGTGWYANVFPTSPQYIQFEYPDYYILKSFDVKSTTNAAGYEPIKDFAIAGSNDVSFNDEHIVFNGTYTRLGQLQTFDVADNNKSFKFYRFYMNSWYPFNAADGASVQAFYARGIQKVERLFLIKQNENYYSINHEFYDETLDAYIPLSFLDFTKGFNIEDLFDIVDMGESQFKSVDKFANFQLVTKQDTLNINVKGNKSNLELIVANGDINLFIAENIDYFNLTNIGDVKLALSIDSGESWIGNNLISLPCQIPKTPYSEMTVEEIELWNQAKEAIYSQGIDITTFNSLDFNTLNADTIRFAYVLSRPSYVDIAETSQLDWKFDMKGYMKQLTDEEHTALLENGVATVISEVENSIINVDVLK